MLKEKVRELLNEQINKELYSAYLYLDFSIYYDQQGLDGFANWYKIQAQEERDHAMLILEYLQNKYISAFKIEIKNNYENPQDIYDFYLRLLNKIYSIIRFNFFFIKLHYVFCNLI